MSFDSTIKDLNLFLEDDAKSIANLLEDYKTNPIKEISSITLNAYDFVVSFNVEPEYDTQKSNAYKAFKNLKGKRGNYVFVMTKDYERESNFNSVHGGAQLNNKSIKKFLKNDYLYIGTAKSLVSRMHQHYECDHEYSKTGSLKLGSNARKTLNGHFVIYAFCIKNDYKEYYSIIGPKVEKYLHDNLDFLVGNK